MKKMILMAVIAFLFSNSAKPQQQPGAGCHIHEKINNNYSKKDTILHLLLQYSNIGIPGLVVEVYTPKEGYWGTSMGFSITETKQPMELCQLQYLQSISKTYMATAILKLFEEGKIDLDAPITKYLPARYCAYLDKPGSIKVRNLLNHTSGVPEYSNVPEYIAYLIANPEHSFTTEEFLSYIKGKKQEFTPGSKYAYTNTNYHLLALIADSVYGSHEKLIRQKILIPLHLENTFYKNNSHYLDNPNVVNSYLDRNGNGQVENATSMQKVSVACSKGDDGFVATPSDAINFLKALMQIKILHKATMLQMMDWVNDEDGKPVYGLGLFHVFYGGQIGYGHGGAGIGAGSGLYYFPAKQVYVFLGTNIGTLIDGPITEKIGALKMKLIAILTGD